MLNSRAPQKWGDDSQFLSEEKNAGIVHVTIKCYNSIAR